MAHPFGIGSKAFSYMVMFSQVRQKGDPEKLRLEVS